MRPPICAICHKRFNPGKKSGLISFSLSEEEKIENLKFDTPGYVGHPKGLEWFCEEHYHIAERYTDIPLAEALPLIKNMIEKNKQNK
jgi:hypothetical protein